MPSGSFSIFWISVVCLRCRSVDLDSVARTFSFVGGFCRAWICLASPFSSVLFPARNAAALIALMRHSA